MNNTTQNKPINGNSLIEIGYPENEILGIALKINKKRTGFTKAEMLDKYTQVMSSPQDFTEDKIFKSLAEAFINGVHLPKVDEDIIPLTFDVSIFELVTLKFEFPYSIKTLFKFTRFSFVLSIIELIESLNFLICGFEDVFSILYT